MKRDQKLKLPDDFLGTVKAFLNTPPVEKPSRKKASKRKAKTSVKKSRRGG